MKFLELPVRFITEEQANKMSDLEGLSVPFDRDDYSYEGILYVNPSQIVCFNEDSGGNVNLILADGYGHMVFMPFIEFVELIERFNDK